jgi:hypothetical protein
MDRKLAPCTTSRRHIRNHPTVSHAGPVTPSYRHSGALHRPVGRNRHPVLFIEVKPPATHTPWWLYFDEHDWVPIAADGEEHGYVDSLVYLSWGVVLLDEFERYKRRLYDL